MRYLILPILLSACSIMPSSVQEDADKLCDEFATQTLMLTDYTRTCAGVDSDGNGYVSCTIVHKLPDGRVDMIALECPAGPSLNGIFNSTCRPARAVLNGTN